MNRKGVPKNNSLGVIGVYTHGKGFRARITDPETGKFINLGTYPTIDEAIKSRKEAELKYY